MPEYTWFAIDNELNNWLNYIDGSVHENFEGHGGLKTCKNIIIAGPASQLHISTVGINVILTNNGQSSRTCKYFICQSTSTIASVGVEDLQVS